ncbi:P-loop containing nucleoside triphosphate hydrolase protein [Spinellus fusiger]|nr:P-loop containing nucleoside triphosphate hydrolase protein [Spinellus fusiger]
MPLKIIGAGFGRTGTKSLHEALEILGYRTHHMFVLFEDHTQDPAVWEKAYDDPKSHENDWEKIYQHFDAALDWPTVSFYKELSEEYPDAKVILTVRSAESWYTSLQNSILKKTEPESLVGLHPHVLRCIQMHRKLSMNGYLNDLSKATKEGFIKIFNDHIEEVKRNIPAHRLLVLELGEGWDRLCKFLDVEVPSVPYPHVNSSGDEFFAYINSLT